MITEITFPVASILENAEAIVNACEDLELSPNKSTQDESSSSSSSSSSPSASSSASSMPNIILTELAALIHLRQYSHAKHLWKRYSSQQDNPQLQQFVTLWKAVTPLLRAHSQDCTTTIDASTLGVGVGDSTGGGDISNVYGSLQACQHMNPKLEPLATYAVQLQTSIRGTFAKAIERSFESIEHERCKMLLGYLNNGDTSDGDMDKFLMGRNWSKEMGTSLWIPYYNPATRNASASKENSSDNDSDVYGNVHVHVHAGSSSSNRIEYLTQMVGFMETQRFNV